MLHKLDLLPQHLSFNLNKKIYYFLLKIKDIPTTSSFAPYDKYFTPTFKLKIDRSKKLREKFEVFFDAFKTLPQADREIFLKKYRASQYVEEILDDSAFNGKDIQLDALPNILKEPTKDLFLYLYEKTLLGYDKKGHYKLLFDQILSTICPFCGLEKLSHPDFVCQDYDHILYKGNYPFVSVNMTNLIPMGIECNRNHKKTTDVLYGASGKRRKFLYPFTNSIPVKVLLNGSVLPAGGTDKGTWTITFDPNDEYVQTWNSVFEIEERYKKSELERYFSYWLKLFKDFLRKRNIQWDEASLRTEFKNYGESLQDNLLDTSNIIKGAMFTFLSATTDQGFINAVLKDLNS